MAKKRSARMAARKVKDKWRSKQWYTIRAPQIFNEKELGETLADEPEKLEGRVAEATLQDVTGDFSKQHVKCNFKIRGTRGTDAVTTFYGHDLTSDYVRRLIRRGHSKIEEVVDIRTADGFQIRLKPMIVTDRRVQSNQGTAIREIARDVLNEKAALPYNELVKEIVQGDIAKAIYDRSRLIMPLKRVEIRKSELLAEPSDAVEILDVFAPPQEPEAPEEEDEASDEASEDAGEDGEEEDADAEEAEDAAEDEVEEEAEDADEGNEDEPTEASAAAADDADDAEAPSEGDQPEDAEEASEDEEPEQGA